MNLKILSTSLILTLLLINHRSFATEPVVKKHQRINVTANRISTPEDEVGSSSIVLIGDELSDDGHNSAVRALQNLPGIEILNQGGAGKAASIFIRGANSEHTLVLIDGVKANDPISPTRAFDFARLNLDNIERIEVIKGPQSVLYGSDALAGVVNIITKGGRKNDEVEAYLESGSFQSHKLGLETRGQLRTTKYSFSGSRFSTEGFSSANAADGNSERDGHGQTDLSLKLERRIGKKSEALISMRYIDAESELDNGGGAGNDDPNFVGEADELFSRLQFKSPLFDENLETIFSLSSRKIERKHINSPDLVSTIDANEFFKGDENQIALQNNYYFDISNVITLGAEHKSERGESHSFSPTSAETTSLFVQSKNRWKNWFGTLGLRHDGHSRGKVSATTFRLAPGYIFLSTGTRFYTSIGSGFKTPSLSQLFDPQYGNAALKPEEVLGFDIGFEQNFLEGKHHLGVTYFKNEFKNLFSFDSAFKSINLDQSETSGLEFDFSSKMNHSFQVSGNWTHLISFENKTTQEKLVRRPRNSWSLRLHYTLQSGIIFTSRYRHLGRRDDFDANNFSRVSLPGHEVLDFKMSYTWAKGKEALIRVENLLDREYEEIDGYGTSRLALYGGLKISLL